jgi:hypothetical protein
MNSAAARRTLLFASLATVCVISGCHERTDQGGVAFYRFPWWDGLLQTAGGILGVTVGSYALNVSFRSRFRNRVALKLGFLLVMVSAGVAFLIGPSKLTDRVVIDDTHFETTYGFWLHPTHRSVRFDEVLAMRLVEVSTKKGRVSNQLQCRRNDGELVDVPLGDLFCQAVHEVLKRAQAHGVAVGVEADIAELVSRVRSRKPASGGGR